MEAQSGASAPVAATEVHQGSEWTRVVVLTPPRDGDGGLSDALKGLFAARDWFAVEQHDPYMAMAELCLRERAQAARSAWGLRRMEQIALVIVEPQGWPHLQDLVQAIHRYVPTASVWLAADANAAALTPFIAGHPAPPIAPNPTAKPFPGSDARDNGVASSVPFRPVDSHDAHAFDRAAPVAQQASLRLTNEASLGAAAISDESQPSGHESPSSGRITREEIDMLLRSDEEADTR